MTSLRTIQRTRARPSKLVPDCVVRTEVHDHVVKPAIYELINVNQEVFSLPLDVNVCQYTHRFVATTRFPRQQAL